MQVRQSLTSNVINTSLLVAKNLSRKELKLTRKELKKSAAAQNEIKDTQIRQKFESTFFALLNQHNQILEKLLTDDILQKVIPMKDVGLTSISSKKFVLLEVINSKFKGEYKLHGHYFRVLYQLLKFIALNVPESKIHSLNKDTQPFTPSTDEKMYSNMVRAFLSSDVVLLLAINCYCSKGDDDIYCGYKWLVEHYAFFEHLPLDNETQLLSEIKEYYNESVFGNNESLSI
ncbi:MAG: putative phage abortive infection protein [Methylococcales bacterium]